MKTVKLERDIKELKDEKITQQLKLQELTVSIEKLRTQAQKQNDVIWNLIKFGADMNMIEKDSQTNQNCTKEIIRFNPEEQKAQAEAQPENE